jgi:hypothetical protein
MSSPGPGLWLERPKARGTFIRKPVVEKICVPGSSLTRRSNEEKCFSPRVINFFEVGYWYLSVVNSFLGRESKLS